ncbi:amino-terminal domain terpene synthase [Medicago truncatula]|uniref:Amino-terminal domain terpene synthase n=1 Tax=Medicago truncatula TaxID=3880 RepID=G7KBV8_MEDTR|nr:amino-terminal domain terpene synthase [Medicago truncatula]
MIRTTINIFEKENKLATFLSYEGEQILDEANAFTSMHLKDLSEGRSSILIDQVNHSLELPLHRRVRSLEVRWYIDSYENRKDANKVLLEAAKLNFNIVQSTLQQDLKEMSRDLFWACFPVKLDMRHFWRFAFKLLIHIHNFGTYGILLMFP